MNEKKTTKKWNHPTRNKDGEHTILYTRWSAMRRRCNPNCNDYNKRYYKINNITICKEWESFDAFADWAISNGYRDDLSLDRIDHLGNYCPDNCRWVTMAENIRERNSRYDWSERKTSRKVINKETGEIFNTIKDAAKKYATTQSKDSTQIGKCCLGKVETAYGYHWEYYKED